MRKYHGTEGVTRALQSRIAKRGKFIASAEREYNAQREIARAVSEAGVLPTFEAYGPCRQIREHIKAFGHDQKLDRDILLELYSIGLQHHENDVIAKERSRAARVKARLAALEAATTPIA